MSPGLEARSECVALPMPPPILAQATSSCLVPWLLPRTLTPRLLPTTGSSYLAPWLLPRANPSPGSYLAPGSCLALWLLPRPLAEGAPPEVCGSTWGLGHMGWQAGYLEL